MLPLLIKNGLVVTSQCVNQQDILIQNGVIQSLGPGLEVENADIIDAYGKMILPGGVDVHTHMPWPAGSYISSDTLASGTKAAAFGGVTTILDFAIPDEKESLNDALKRKMDEASDCAWVDYSFHLNIRGDVAPKLAEIAGLVKAGFPSFKVFMAYEGFRLSDAEMLQVLKTVQQAGGMVNVHAENGPLADFLTGQLLSVGKCSLNNYPQARATVCETEAVAHLLAYQRETGARVHIHHVSTAGAVDLIANGLAEGLLLSAETCPHYLVFTQEDYMGDVRKAASLVCAPSIKSFEDQKALWFALAEGTLNTVATDHCPYTLAQKENGLNDFSRVPGGMAGVETCLPLLYTHGVLNGRLTLEQLAQVWAEGPARSFGLFPQKGGLSVGNDADLVIFDPDQTWTLRASELHMNTDCLAYEGMQVIGKPVLTMLRGKIICRQKIMEAARPTGECIFRSFRM